MNRCSIPVMLLVVAAAAQEITVSKDSLWVLNRYRADGPWADTLTIYNNDMSPILLDSAWVHISEMDASGSLVEPGRLEVRMQEQHTPEDPTLHYMTIHHVAGLDYRLDFSMTSRPILSAGPGDSVRLSGLEIGRNFTGAVPRYPNYIRGILSLLFSNGRRVEITVYSDDLRPVPVSNPVPRRTRTATASDRGRYLINGTTLPSGACTEAKRKRVRHRIFEK